MSDQTQPYEPVVPGQLLTADLFNQVQTDIKTDISKQIGDAVKSISFAKTAENAENADNLEHQSLKQITQLIIDEVLKQLPQQTGYKIVFKRLQSGTTATDKRSDVDKMKVIEHGLKMPPLVDVYQLDYFHVVCATGDTVNDRRDAWVNFYLYHTSERRIRFQPAGSTTPINIEIEPAYVYPSPINLPTQPDPVSVYPQPHKILFSEMLHLYKIQYEDTNTLDDLETDFWKAFWAKPNDEFDQDQYCHSPWFEKCCGEKRTVLDLKQSGAWDDIWFQMRPFKTINYPVHTTTSTPSAETIAPNSPFPTPTQIQVTHFDFNTLGIGLLGDPDYDPFAPETNLFNRKELKVMLLLKV